MAASVGRPQTQVPTQEKQAVALSSIAAAALLTALKTAVGVLTGSLGILSEAAHSGLDLAAAIITYISVRASDKPADSTHPFGHGKFEHLSAFVETGLLLVTCAWIVIEVIRRIFFERVDVHATIPAFAVMGFAIVVDTVRSRSLGRTARKYGSQALEADALHFSTDVYGSAAVILGLALAAAARHWSIGWLRLGDPAAAFFVAGITLYISLRLGKRTVDALVDAAPEGTLAQIDSAVAGVPGVLRHDRVRARQSGNQLFVDMRLQLESNIPIEHAQAVEDEVESRVRAVFPGADIVIHSAPRAPTAGNVVEKIRAVAHRNNFQIHDVTPYAVDGRVSVSLDLELDPNLTLEAAHAQASGLERQIKQTIPQVSEVNVHIEPMLNRVESAQDAHWLRVRMEKNLLTIARKTPGVVDCHSVEAHQVGDNFFVNLHCTLEPDLPLRRVHEITEDLELEFRKEFPQIMKVSVHAEPPGAE
ncbi:MAG: cation-efflux pump [Acidobacteriota bacterium]|nr:cation-efflux pump [Acidobacteriota bacterium]